MEDAPGDLHRRCTNTLKRGENEFSALIVVEL
jgi:hypothetical protein